MVLGHDKNLFLWLFRSSFFLILENDIFLG